MIKIQLYNKMFEYYNRGLCKMFETAILIVKALSHLSQNRQRSQISTSIFLTLQVQCFVLYNEASDRPKEWS